MNGRDHRIGWWTVTSFVPSGNVASTCTSWIISGTPVHHLASLEDVRARLHQLGHVRPSRAPSSTKSEISATASG